MTRWRREQWYCRLNKATWETHKVELTAPARDVHGTWQEVKRSGTEARAIPLSGKGVMGRVRRPILGNTSCLSARLGLVERPSTPRQASPHRPLALDHDKKMVLGTEA